MPSWFAIAVAVAALSCPVGAEAASITNRDAKEYKITIIEIGKAPVNHVLKKDGQLKDVCVKGCIVRLNDSENDEYELEGTEIVSIEEERAAGHSVRDAVLSSATNRFRPMMLAAMSTVLGLLPIAPTVFWGPMAFAIMGGLLVATLLTLIFLPTVYMAVLGQEDSNKASPATEQPA